MPFAEIGGNVVQNGGFEQGLLYWLGVDNVGLEACGNRHEGMAAAAMGKDDNTVPAAMFQDVPASAFETYKLQFAVSGVGPDPGCLVVDVRYLNCVGADLGSAFGCGPITVLSDESGYVPAEVYKVVSAVTDPAPTGTAAARLSFTKSPGRSRSYLIVDSVIFTNL